MADLMRASDKDRARRLIFFEGCFYELDETGKGAITEDECDCFLSYAALDLDPACRAELFRRADFVANSSLNRVEFVTMCVEELWDVPMEQLTAAMTNMNIARKSRKTRNRAYWTGVADVADKWARIVIPLLYLFAMIIVFNLRLADEYFDNDQSVQFDGIHEATLTTTGLVLLSSSIAIVVAIGAAWLTMRTVAARNAEKLAVSLKEASRSSLADTARRLSTLEG